LVGIKRRNRHRGIGLDFVVGRDVFGAQLQVALLFFATGSEAIDSKAQVRQHLIIDNIVEKYGIRIEAVLRQDYAVIKGFFLANGYFPVFAVYDYYLRISGYESL
jgi:hypothetical protein